MKGEKGPLFLKAGLGMAVVWAPFFFGAVPSWAFLLLSAWVFFLAVFHPAAVFELRNFPPLLLWGLSVIWGWLLLQYFFFSLQPGETGQRLLFWTSCAASAVLIQLLRRRAVSWLMSLLILAAFCEAAYGLIQSGLGIDWVLWREKEAHRGFATGTYMNRSHFAGLLEMALGLLMGFFLQALRKKKFGRIFFYASALVLIGAAFFRAGSRMGMASYAAAAIFFCFYLWKRSPADRKGLAFFGAAGLAAGIFWGTEALSSRAWEQIVTGSESESGGRWLVWADVLRILQDRPWRGIGLGSFEWVYPSYQSEGLQMGWAHAHNDYLELAAELGIPAFGLLTASFLAAGIFLWRRQKQAAEPYFPLVWGSLISLTSLALHGLADFNFAIPANTWIYFLIFAMAWRLSDSHQKRGQVDLRVERESNKTYLSPKKVTVTCVFLGLFLVSIAKAWAGWGLYRAEAALDNNDPARALTLLEQAKKWESQNFRLDYRLAEAAWKSAVRSADPGRLASAEKQFERLTREHPYYGRAWLYLGLVKLEKARLQGGAVSAEEWSGIRPILEKASQGEPSSAWISYVTGIQTLSQSSFLSESEKNAALGKIRRAFALHYPDQPSDYLREGLSRLWSIFGDFDLLSQVIPRDEASYGAWIQWMDENRLWRWHEEVYQEYLVLNRARYDALCREGEHFLDKKNDRRAYLTFQKACWMNKRLSPAKAGMLVAAARFQEFPTDYRQMLRDLLEEEEENLEKFLHGLAAAVERTQDPYLLGLYAYRLGDDKAAQYAFARISAADFPMKRRLQALSYARLRDTPKALEILRPALEEEEPDLRELLLLKELGFADLARVEAKIKETLDAGRRGSDWKGWAEGVPHLSGRLAYRGRIGTNVNLLPGPVTFKLPLSSIPGTGGENAYVLVRLWEGSREIRLGSAAVDSGKAVWDFSADTSGGKRWLELELVNGRKKGERRGPVLIPGTLEILYSS